MKKTLLILAIAALGCSSPTDPQPGPVSGAWQGVIQLRGPYLTTAYLHVEENKVMGMAWVEYLPLHNFWFFDVYGEMYGTEKAFGLNLQFADESYDKWVYTGYVDGYDLCLIFEMGETYCLEPAPGPPGTFDRF